MCVKHRHHRHQHHGVIETDTGVGVGAETGIEGDITVKDTDTTIEGMEDMTDMAD